MVRSQSSHVILQAGPHRSGTTFQFHVLCAATCLAHADEDVACDFVTNPVGRSNESKQTFRVIKTHDMKAALQLRIELGKEKSSLFMTSNEGAPVSKWEQAKNVPQADLDLYVDYVQKFDELLLQGYSVAYRYARMFDLDEQGTGALLSYIRYWEILRKCCGAQMSKDYRLRLQGQHARKEKGLNDFGYDMCEAYDIGAVEKLLVQTEVFLKCGSRIEALRRASSKDLEFDGTYCARVQESTARENWVFNDERYLEPAH